MIRFILAVPLMVGVSYQAAAATCGALQDRVVKKSDIELLSGDAAISSAQMATMPATMERAEPSIEYCKVLGSIAPIDPNAPPIRFQINMPVQWNGRAVQYGGGGFNGVLISGLAPLRDAPPNLPPPVARGFMTYGTDSRTRQCKTKGDSGIRTERRGAREFRPCRLQEGARRRGCGCPRALRPRAGQSLLLRRLGRRARRPYHGSALSCRL